MGIDGARRAVGSSLKPALALAPAPAAAAAAVARGGGGGGAGGGRSSQVRTFDLPGIVGETGMFFIFLCVTPSRWWRVERISVSGIQVDVQITE